MYTAQDRELFVQTLAQADNELEVDCRTPQNGHMDLSEPPPSQKIHPKMKGNCKYIGLTPFFDPDTSYEPHGKALNGDVVPYVAQNPNPDGSYTYPPGTPAYAMNNDNGKGAWGVLGDNATPNNNATGRVEVSPAMADALGVTQYNDQGQILNSTTGANISTYYYPKSK